MKNTYILINIFIKKKGIRFVKKLIKILKINVAKIPSRHLFWNIL